MESMNEQTHNEVSTQAAETGTSEKATTALTPQGEGATGDSKTGDGIQAQTTTGDTNTGGVPAGKEGETPFTPSYKFKVKDKELEFDEFLKPVVTTKEVEAKIREMYEKAHGIEEVKTAREGIKKQLEEWQGKYTSVEKSLQTLGSYVKKGDFRTFFEALNIPKDKIIQYAIEELKFQELPPEQRAALEQQREQQTLFEQAQVQTQTLQQQMEELVRNQTAMELNQVLAAPEVSTIVSAYDAKMGKPGAFQTEVIRRGQYYEAVHKTSPPASQLVEEVLSLIGFSAQAQQGVSAPDKEASGPTVPAQKKPVLPVFQGGGNTSPAKRVPTSIDDLRKMRQQIST